MAILNNLKTGATWFSLRLAVVLSDKWLDGPSVSQKSFNPTELTAEQQKRLVEIVREYRPGLSIAGFSDRVLVLLEDVSGFEIVSDSEAQSIINKLWSLYHDQIK